MSESEIKIIVKAVDDASATLKQVENSTLSAMDTFQKQTTALISLGNAAASVDSIFDSYQNMQGRVENASIRVEEAQKNLRDAQYRLNKVLKDGKSDAEDIAKAQDDVATSANRVKIAQNNQERANNQVLGTYINMGVQITTLLGSLPTLIKTVGFLTTTAWASIPALAAQAAGFLAITIAGAPLWVILLAIIAAVTAAIYLWKKFRGTAEETAKSQQEVAIPTIQKETQEIQTLTAATNEATNATQRLTAAQIQMGAHKKGKKDMSAADATNLAKFGVSVVSNSGGPITHKASGTKFYGGTQQNDFVMRPGQPAVPFSSKDTLIGMKDTKGIGGGMTVNIGNVYGVNATDIAKELQRELRNAVRVA